MALSRTKFYLTPVNLMLVFLLLQDFFKVTNAASNDALQNTTASQINYGDLATQIPHIVLSATAYDEVMKMLAVVPEVHPMSYAQQLENQLKSIITVDFENIALLQQQEVQFIADSLVDLAQNNLIVKCALDCLLKTNLKIIIAPIDIMTIPGTDEIVLSAYKAAENAIYIIAKAHQLNAQVMQHKFINILSIAMHAYDNSRARRWPKLAKASNQLFHDIYVWGAPQQIFATSQQYADQVPDLVKVNKLFAEDFLQVEHLYDLVNSKKLSKENKKFMKKYYDLIVKSNYQHTLSWIPSGSIVEVIKNYAAFAYDAIADKYVAAGGERFVAQDGLISNYIQEYGFYPRPYLVLTRTDPENKTPRNLLKDLLLNLRNTVNLNNKQEKILIPSARVASIYEILAPYPLLLQELFPRMQKHMLARAAEEHRQCLQPDVEPTQYARPRGPVA